VIGGGSATKSFYIRSLGSQNLLITDVVSDNPAFVPDDVSGSDITSGDFQEVIVDFQPAASPLQSYTGVLTIACNDPDHADPNFITVFVTGEGVSPNIAVSPVAIDLGTPKVGDIIRGAGSVTVTNDGTSDLVLDVSTSDTDPTVVTKPAGPRDEGVAGRETPVAKPAAEAAWGEPHGDPVENALSLAVGPQGDYYVGTMALPNGDVASYHWPRGQGEVMKVDPDGVALPFFSQDSGYGYDLVPSALAVGKSGTVYICDEENGRVIRQDPSGEVSLFADVSSNFGGSPNSIAIGPHGFVYVGVYFMSAGIHRIDPATGALTESYDLGGAYGTPFGLTFDPWGVLWVAFRNETNGSSPPSAFGQIWSVVIDHDSPESFTAEPMLDSSAEYGTHMLYDSIVADGTGFLYVGGKMDGADFVGVYAPTTPTLTLERILLHFDNAPESSAWLHGPVCVALGADGVLGVTGAGDATVPYSISLSGTGTRFADRIVRFDLGIPAPPVGPGPQWLDAKPAALVVPPGGSRQIDLNLNTVALDPLTTYTSYLRLDSNDPLTPLLSVEVTADAQSATGAAFAYPLSLGFGAVSLGGSVTDTVYVRNIGSSDLAVSDVSTDSPDVFEMVLPLSSSLVLAPGEPLAVPVRFSPDPAAGPGPRSGTLTVASGDDPISVSLEGEALGALVVSPTVLDFTLGPEGAATSAFTVHNTGNTPLDFSAEIRFGVPPPPPPTKPVAARPVTLAAAAAVPGEILVKLRPDAGTRLQKVTAEMGLRTVQSFSEIGIHRLQVQPGTTLEEALERLRNRADVAFAEPNYIVRADVIPDDPMFPDLWGMHNTGQGSGMVDADIDAVEAWDLGDGEEVIIAILDTGVDWQHPDLAPNMWVNQGEVPGNGVDDDGNGYVDDVRGWDFYNGDANPADDNGHGTHVAGIAAARGWNNLGVLGVAPRARIMALKFLDSDGYGSVSDAVAAMEYAVAMGAHVSNNSWGWEDYDLYGYGSLAFQEALRAADAAGVVFVASAGNSYDDTDQSPHFPSGYTVPNVISVMATDRSDSRQESSNYGRTNVDLAAPGVAIFSTWPGNTYRFETGTSMAAPHVSGAAALVYGTLLSNVGDPPAPGLQMEVKTRILGGVDIIAGLADTVATGGRLNAYKALFTPWLSLGVTGETIPPGGSVTIPLTIDAEGCEAGDEKHATVVLYVTSVGGTTSQLDVPVTLHVAGMGSITGRVVYYDDPSVGVPGVTLVVAPAGDEAVTDGNGEFEFPGLVPGEEYTITSSKSEDTGDAVRGSDAVLVLQKTAFMLPTPLTSDQEYAGDVNGDGLVRNADAVGILRYWAFMPDGTGQAGSWRFQPEQTTVTALAQVPDIKAFVLGDVQPNWPDRQDPGASPKLVADAAPPLDASNARWQGDRLMVPLRLLGDRPVESMLLSLSYDPALLGADGVELVGAGDNYLLVENTGEPGEMHVALAGVPTADAGSMRLELAFSVGDGPGTAGTDLDRLELLLTRFVLNNTGYDLGAGVPLNIRRLPESFVLDQNHPNPFNPQTQIRFGLPEPVHVRLAIYNMLGQRVQLLVDGSMEAGYHTVVWDGRTATGGGVSSGVYIYQLETSSGFRDTKRMMFLK